MPLQLPDIEREHQSDIAACREMLRGGSRTFFAASHVLPRHVSAPATALYAFCRLADDAVDVDGGKAVALTRLHERLDRAYAGRPFPTATDRAFAELSRALPFPADCRRHSWKASPGMQKAAGTRIFQH